MGRAYIDLDQVRVILCTDGALRKMGSTSFACGENRSTHFPPLQSLLNHIAHPLAFFHYSNAGVGGEVV